MEPPQNNQRNLSRTHILAEKRYLMLELERLSKKKKEILAKIERQKHY
ncbi:MAG: hypothetical protein ACTSU5_16610 [Promethearchaeota archaeon]